MFIAQGTKHNNEFKRGHARNLSDNSRRVSITLSMIKNVRIERHLSRIDQLHSTHCRILNNTSCQTCVRAATSWQHATALHNAVIEFSVARSKPMLP